MRNILHKISRKTIEKWQIQTKYKKHMHTDTNGYSEFLLRNQVFYSYFTHILIVGNDKLLFS